MLQNTLTIANTLIRHIAHYDRWLPGRHTFAVILVMTGTWWVWQGFNML